MPEHHSHTPQSPQKKASPQTEAPASESAEFQEDYSVGTDSGQTHRILSLQRRIGNRATLHYLQRAGAPQAEYTHEQQMQDYNQILNATQILEGTKVIFSYGSIGATKDPLPNLSGAMQADHSDGTAMRLHLLKKGYRALKPALKRYKSINPVMVSNFEALAKSQREQLERQLADERIAQEMAALEESSLGLGSVEDDRQRLQMAAMLNGASGVLDQVKGVYDNVKKYSDMAKEIADVLGPDTIRSIEASKLLSAEQKPVFDALAAAQSAEKAGERFSKQLSDASLMLKTFGMALSIADAATRDKKTKSAAAKLPNGVAQGGDAVDQVFGVMKYAADIGEFGLRQVAQYRGEAVLARFASQLDMLSKASKVMGTIGAGFGLMRDLAILLDDRSSAEQVESATWSSLGNVATLLPLLGAKASTLATPLTLMLIGAQVNLETAKMIYNDSFSGISNQMSPVIFNIIDTKANLLSSTARRLQAHLNLAQNTGNLFAAANPADVWDSSHSANTTDDQDLPRTAQHLRTALIRFIDVATNPESESVRNYQAAYRPGGYPEIYEYFDTFRSVLTSSEVHESDYPALLATAEEVLLTYRTFRLQKPAIIQNMQIKENEEKREQGVKTLLTDKDSLLEQLMGKNASGG